MNVKLYIAVVDGTIQSWEATSGELWTREVETSFAPTPGVHDVVLWATQEEGTDGGPMWSVKRTFMLSDGMWAVELSHLVVDPIESARDTIARWRGGVEPWRVWWTESDGDPTTALRAGGWLPYGEGTS